MGTSLLITSVIRHSLFLSLSRVASSANPTAPTCEGHRLLISLTCTPLSTPSDQVCAQRVLVDQGHTRPLSSMDEGMVTHAPLLKTQGGEHGLGPVFFLKKNLFNSRRRFETDIDQVPHHR